MMHSQGLLLHLPPGSTPEFALPLSGLGCQLTGGKITPKSLKNAGLDPGSPLCCVCRAKVAAVLPLAGAGDGQVRTARAGALFSKWYTGWGKEQQSFLTFLSLFLSVCKKMSTCSPRSCPWLSSRVSAVSSEAVSSLPAVHLLRQSLCWYGTWHTLHPCQRKPAQTQGTLWDAELQNLQDPCGCPCQRALLTSCSWSGHSSQHREKGTKWDLSLRILDL